MPNSRGIGADPARAERRRNASAGETRSSPWRHQPTAPHERTRPVCRRERATNRASTTRPSASRPSARPRQRWTSAVVCSAQANANSSASQAQADPHPARARQALVRRAFSGGRAAGSRRQAMSSAAVIVVRQASRSPCRRVGRAFVCNLLRSVGSRRGCAVCSHRSGEFRWALVARALQNANARTRHGARVQQHAITATNASSAEQAEFAKSTAGVSYSGPGSNGATEAGPVVAAVALRENAPLPKRHIGILSSSLMITSGDRSAKVGRASGTCGSIVRRRIADETAVMRRGTRRPGSPREGARAPRSGRHRRPSD